MAFFHLSDKLNKLQKHLFHNILHIELTMFRHGESSLIAYISVPGRAPVAQRVVHPTHTRLVPESKHAWCKNPLAFVMMAS